MKCKSIDCDNHPFDTEEQAHRNARNTKYGLNGVVWTENLQRVHKISHSVRTGTIWVNCWFVRDLHNLNIKNDTNCRPFKERIRG